jgi:hypothetical protein
MPIIISSIFVFLLSIISIFLLIRFHLWQLIVFYFVVSLVISMFCGFKYSGLLFHRVRLSLLSVITFIVVFFYFLFIIEMFSILSTILLALILTPIIFALVLFCYNCIMLFYVCENRQLFFAQTLYGVIAALCLFIITNIASKY